MALSARPRFPRRRAATIRTAFIGIGIRGKSLVPQVLEQRNTRVTAICDIDPNARDAGLTLAKRDSPRAFTDWRAMLDFKDIDAVVIATPCYLHAEMAAAALQAGKYVYCEKPLGITPEQVQTVLNASRGAKTFLQIGQQLRYFPVVREAVRQIHSGDLLGRTLVIKAQRDSLPLSPEAAAAPARLVQGRPLLGRSDRRKRDPQHRRVQLDREQPARSRVRARDEILPAAPLGRTRDDGRLQRRVCLSERHPPRLQPALHAPARSAQADQRPVVRRFWAEGRARHDGRER